MGPTVVTEGQSQQPVRRQTVSIVAGYSRMGDLKMVAGTNISQFRTLLNEAPPEDLVTIVPLLFNRIGTLGQSQQERVIQEIQRDPQAKSAFQKLQSFTH